MEKLTLDRYVLKKFGIIMGIAFSVVALLVFARHRHNVTIPLTISAVFFLLSLFSPSLLKPVYIAWMRLAYVLSWINTRIILSLLFYTIFTPIGLMMRLFGRDLLDRKIDRNTDSYWKKKEKATFNPADYERQF